MKRDMELIRAILQAAEAGNLQGPIPGYTDDELKYHRALAIDDDLLVGSVKYSSTGEGTDIPLGVIVRSLTSEGHDVLEAIGTEAKWQRFKDFLLRAGKELTIEAMKRGMGLDD